MLDSSAPPAAVILGATWASTAQLRAQGLTRDSSSALVRAGRLLRLRRGRYAPHDLAIPLASAGSLGGRLDCVSLLALLGVFVRSSAVLHVQFDREASRLPSRDGGIVAHWRDSPQPRDALSADIVSALAQAVLCQTPRDAVATLDSALHRRLITKADLGDIAARLPRRRRRLITLVDGRCESGPETLMRLLLRGLGCDVQLQVVIPDVGRVDFVVDGWLIIECDSRAHHDGWDAHRRDRRRDMAAAAHGYTTVRALAEDILFDPAAVIDTVRRALAHRR